MAQRKRSQGLPEGFGPSVPKIARPKTVARGRGRGRGAAAASSADAAAGSGWAEMSEIPEYVDPEEKLAFEDSSFSFGADAEEEALDQVARDPGFWQGASGFLDESLTTEEIDRIASARSKGKGSAGKSGKGKGAGGGKGKATAAFQQFSGTATPCSACGLDPAQTDSMHCHHQHAIIESFCSLSHKDKVVISIVADLPGRLGKLRIALDCGSA